MQQAGSKILDSRAWNQNLSRILRKQTLATLVFQVPFKIISRVTATLLNVMAERMQHCCSYLRTKETLDDLEDDV